MNIQRKRNINQLIGILSRTYEVRRDPKTNRKYSDFGQYKAVCRVLMGLGAPKVRLNQSRIDLAKYIMANAELIKQVIASSPSFHGGEDEVKPHQTHIKRSDHGK